jgi:phosphohistidine swiveling domain-containing protein
LSSEDEWLIDTVPSRRLPVYTRFNANDVLPNPITPLGASLAWLPHIFAGYSLGYAEVGSSTLEEAAGDEVWPAGAFFYGHLYVNVTMARLSGVRGGIGWKAVDEAFFGSHPDAPPHAARPADDDPVAKARYGERIQWALTATDYPDLEEDRALARAARAGRPDLATLSAGGLVARARSMMPYERLMWRGEVVAGSLAAIGPAVAGQAVAGLPDVNVVDLIGPAGEVVSAAPSFILWDLSRMVCSDPTLMDAFDAGSDGLAGRLSAEPGFAASFARFLAEYGYRGPSEWDLGAQSWESHPELALALIDRLRLLEDDASPSARRDRQAARAAESVRRVETLIGDNAERLQTLHLALESARRFAGWRERGKSNCIRVLHESRMALRELGRRLHATGALADPEHVFMALDDELDTLVLAPETLGERLAERHSQWLDLFGLDVPLFVSGTEPMAPLSAIPRLHQSEVTAAAPGTVLSGEACSAGTARGHTRVVTDPASAQAFAPGEVLVAPQTDPSWTPLFLVASAVVVEVGAMASHAMIVSRELGIPCVAGIPGITSLLRDGADVEVDGGRGTVTVHAGDAVTV